MNRMYFPKNLDKPLAQIHAEHFSHFCTPDRYGLWEERRVLWDKIDAMCRRMESGEFSGSVKTVDALMFIQELSARPDPYFNLAGYVISQPILEDLVFFGGLQNLVEDFCLKQYGVPARLLQSKRPDTTAIRVPDITTRLATGHPSVKQIIRDFTKKVSGLWLVEFDCFSRGSVIYFAVQLTPPDLDDPGINYEMVRVGVDLINQMKVSA